ncbi:MAG: DUF1801 domain-containing protein [Ignavibacteriae bacterium]|nr:DUF1801 domain-containing protein [Ignavibacteriota bacterium]
MKKTNKTKFTNPEVKEVFKKYDKDVREKLFSLRELIFEIAEQTEGVGQLEETLKWNEPSYVTTKPKSGSTIRINRIKNSNKYAMYFNCQTTLVSTFKQIYPTEFKYDGNRAIIFNLEEKVPVKELSHCISLALTYHLNKKNLNPTNMR